MYERKLCLDRGAWSTTNVQNFKEVTGTNKRMAIKICNTNKEYFVLLKIILYQNSAAVDREIMQKSEWIKVKNPEEAYKFQNNKRKLPGKAERFIQMLCRLWEVFISL